MISSSDCITCRAERAESCRLRCELDRAREQLQAANLEIMRMKVENASLSDELAAIRDRTDPP